MTETTDTAETRPAQAPGEVFSAFFKLGLTSFGGPIAHLGYFRDELVTRRKWLSDHAYAELVALCQFLPGPASSQVGFALGMMRAGWLGVQSAVRKGERRPIHRRPYRRVKPVPKRPSMLDPHRLEIDGWLDAEPTITAVGVLARLKAGYPDSFNDNHLRTAQRMVKAWRTDQARRVIRCGTATLEAATTAATVTPTRLVTTEAEATGWASLSCRLTHAT